VFLARYYSGDQIKENEMGRACGTDGEKTDMWSAVLRFDLNRVSVCMEQSPSSEANGYSAGEGTNAFGGNVQGGPDGE
jgi:hypothetical protein